MNRILRSGIWVLLLVAAACTGDPERRVVPPSGKPVPTPVNGRVCINEVNTEAKYIELYNPSTEEADLSGLRIRKNNEGFLKDSAGTDDFTVVDGTKLPAKGFAVINCKGRLNDHEGLALGVSSTGISGSKSLLLELVGKDGGRIDWFVNSSYATPRAADTWNTEAEHPFEVAGRMDDGGEQWYVLENASAGTSNAASAKRIAFTHTVVDFQTAEPNAPSSPEMTYAEGLAYVFDMDAMPEVRVEVTLDEWNRLLTAYDRDSNTEEYVRCTASFTKKGTTHRITEAGLRLRGNTSRRRPEGSGGQTHAKNNADWHHCHFMLNLRKFVKDDAHTVGGVRKLHLKWFKDDPTYVREIYCFDLFRRYDIWTAPKSSYCRLWIHVEGDETSAYYGIYALLEAIDDEYVEAREAQFGDAKHNLWKCTFGADLSSTDPAKFGTDEGNGSVYAYELKTNGKNFPAAREQLKDFITNLRERSGDDFRTWIERVCDVELLLKTYAVNVAVGMWDDYWNNSNNYYLYFNTSDPTAYRVFLIPYDYDNTLGTSGQTGVQSDSGRQDPLRWGSESNPLIHKILQHDRYRAIYLNALRELCADDELFGAEGSMLRIRRWQAMTSPHVDNDTGEDCRIMDAPASWGNHPEYRIMQGGENNFFSVKAQSIPR